MGSRPIDAEAWAELQPIVTALALIRGADVVACCDPERATYTPGAPAVIWGWLVGAYVARFVGRMAMLDVSPERDDAIGVLASASQRAFRARNDQAPTHEANAVPGHPRTSTS